MTKSKRSELGQTVERILSRAMVEVGSCCARCSCGGVLQWHHHKPRGRASVRPSDLVKLKGPPSRALAVVDRTLKACVVRVK